MSVLDSLKECAGAWKGTSTLQDPGRMEPAESPSTATVTPVLAGRFVRLDYTWAYREAPQEGTLLVGLDPKTGAVSAHWADTWHMGHGVMALAGEDSDGHALSVRGSYAAPPGPDWGWRIEVFAEGGTAFRIVMFNIWPEGKEDLAVKAVYSRA